MKVLAKVKVAVAVGCAAGFDAIAQSARKKKKISHPTSYPTRQLLGCPKSFFRFVR